jgi:hypothetical protein
MIGLIKPDRVIRKNDSFSLRLVTKEPKNQIIEKQPLIRDSVLYLNQIFKKAIASKINLERKKNTSQPLSFIAGNTSYRGVGCANFQKIKPENILNALYYNCETYV